MTSAEGRVLVVASVTEPPRISVICIFLDAELYLEEAVESVLAQDYRDFELLLVDDGSTDGSSALARSYAAQMPDRVRYLEHPGHANRGMSAARNLGLREARGEMIAFIDSDDRWRPHKLREQVALLDAMPGVDAVCGTVHYWGSANGGSDWLVPTAHVQDRPIPPIESTLALYPLGDADPPCPSDLLIRRDMLDRIGGFEDGFTGPLQLYEDQAMLSKLYLQGTLYSASKVWIDYRVHDGSCDSSVGRAGLYGHVRKSFLLWFEAYLAGTPHGDDPRIRRALKRALLPYRHPLRARLLRLANRLMRRKPADGGNMAAGLAR